MTISNANGAPAVFCRLRFSVGRLSSQHDLPPLILLFFVRLNDGYNFATENTPTYDAMPLLHEFKTIKHIAPEAYEISIHRTPPVGPFMGPDLSIGCG